MSFRRPYLSKQSCAGKVHPVGSHFAWRVSEPYRGIVAIVLLILLLALLGAMEKVDNDNSVKEYCKGVHERSIPDYNGSYKRQCNNGEPRQ